MRFLGTSAADSLPGPFCACPLCTDARQNPAHRRLRSMFLLDQENLIDCGPDLNAACQIHGVDLSGVKNIFVTHTHEDHFCLSNAGLCKMSGTRGNGHLDVFLSEAGHARMLRLYELVRREFPRLSPVVAYESGLVRLHPVRSGVPFSQGGYRVTAVDTTHRVSDTETAVNYLFERERDGFRLLYASDTGLYPEATYEALRDAALDVLVMEATWGSQPDVTTENHLYCETFLTMLAEMEARRILRPDTQVYATHINDKHTLHHDALQEWFDTHAPRKVVVARDGMRVQPQGG